MKAKKETVPDIRVWCEYCRIRISPNEDHVTAGDKAYHKQCFPKRTPVKRAKKK